MYLVSGLIFCDNVKLSDSVSDKIYIFFYVLFLLGKNRYDGVQNLKLQLVWSARNIS